MTITEVLSYEAFPPQFAIYFLRKIRQSVPIRAVYREGFFPIGSYLVPFVNRQGQVVAWVSFAEEDQANNKSMLVVIPYPKDPTRVYRVKKDGSLEVVCRTTNEDW